MSECQPLITPDFLHTVTGADVSNTTAVEELIVVTSTLIGEELGGCVDPASATMKLRVVCAQYTAYCMQRSGFGPGAVRAEQVGDYRVEYQGASNTDIFDLQVLRDMLASMHGGSAYSTSTLPDRVQSEWWDGVLS